MIKQLPTHARVGISALLIGLLTWLSVFGVLLQSSWQTNKPVSSPLLNFPAQPAQSQLKETLSQLPLIFEANRGQTHPAVQFISRGPGYTLYLTPAETRFELRGKANNRLPIGLHFAGASSDSNFEGVERLPTRSNYFIGNNPSEWRTDVPTFARVRQRNIYPGVDVIFYGNRQQLEYDFVVAPHANPQQIKPCFRRGGSGRTRRWG